MPLDSYQIGRPRFAGLGSSQPDAGCRDTLPFNLKKMYHESVTDINEFLVRDALRERGGLTRTELSTSLGLSPASISRIVRRLVSVGVEATEDVAGLQGDGFARHRAAVLALPDVHRFVRKH